MLRFALPALGFAILAGFLFVGLRLDPSAVPSPLLGKPAPAFALESLREPARQITHADLLGQVSLLNVWATWCVGCRQEHDTLLAIAREGIPIVGLNWKDDRAQALDWLGQLGDPYAEIAFDAEGRVAIDWGVYGAPETFVIDADGTVLYKHIGPLNAQIWRERLLPVVRSAQDPAT